jgi:hypothetical protein
LGIDRTGREDRGRGLRGRSVDIDRGIGVFRRTGLIGDFSPWNDFFRLRASANKGLSSPSIVVLRDATPSIMITIMMNNWAKPRRRSNPSSSARTLSCDSMLRLSSSSAVRCRSSWDRMPPSRSSCRKRYISDAEMELTSASLTLSSTSILFKISLSVRLSIVRIAFDCSSMYRATSEEFPSRSLTRRMMNA